MFKYSLLLLLISLLFGCDQSKINTAQVQHLADTIKPVPAVHLIVPGKSIGSILLNGNADSVAVKWGKPDFSDAAMGASLMTWYTDHKTSGYKTSVYAHRNMGGADENISRIKEIRVTSPEFKTADYAGPGSDLKDVIRLYKLKRSANNASTKLMLYNNHNMGIGFEADSTRKCIAVIVYARGDSSSTYIDMHE